MQIEIVGLERDRKGDHVEAAERLAALEGDQALAARADVRALVGIGQKGAVGGDARVGFEDVVDGLEAEIRHPEPVDVRIDDAEPDIAAAMALEEHFFAGDTFERALSKEHR